LICFAHPPSLTSFQPHGLGAAAVRAGMPQW